MSRKSATPFLVLDASEVQIDVIFVSVDTGGSIGGFELVRLARKKRSRIRTVLAGTPKRAADAAGDRVKRVRI